MFKLNSILKISIILFLSLIIPSFLSLFKLSFDDYVAAQKADVEGASIVKVNTVNNKSANGVTTDQTVVVAFNPFAGGVIQNLSQRPYKFPNAKPENTPKIVNTQAPVSYVDGPNDPVYIYTSDTGRSGESFSFAYAGIKGNFITFYNNNDYDLNNVKIEVRWKNGVNEYVSKYNTSKIQKQKFYYEELSKSAEASIPFDPTKKIDGVKITFEDNAGVAFVSDF